MANYSSICKSLREKHGFTAQKMSQIYGFGINQWRLYENGKAPSDSNARLILLSTNEEIFKVIYLLYRNPSKADQLANQGFVEAFQSEVIKPRYVINQLVKWPRRDSNNKFLLGRIVVIVPAGIVPTNQWLQDKINLQGLWKWSLETTIPRNHQSYMVINRKGKTARSKCRLMWPIVEALMDAREEEDYSLPHKIQI